ncbi:MAG TPA: DMT family transporter, partial [Gaiellaceae bacterium]|nr:DMT family transporter [Gaiellaceae bacterium]
MSRSWASLIRPIVAAGVALAYGACFIAIRAGLAYAPPLAYAGLRALLAGSALLAFAAASRRPLFRIGVPWTALAGVALTSTTLGLGTMFASQPSAGAGIAAVLANLQPLFVVAFAAVYLGERLSRAKVGALALGSAGVILLISPTLDADTG